MALFVTISRRSYQILSNFAASARNEVALERLTGGLIGAVEETMQPEQVSLWINTPRLK